MKPNMLRMGVERSGIIDNNSPGTRYIQILLFLLITDKYSSTYNTEIK